MNVVNLLPFATKMQFVQILRDHILVNVLKDLLEMEKSIVKVLLGVLFLSGARVVCRFFLNKFLYF